MTSILENEQKLQQLEAQWKDGMVVLAQAMIAKRDSAKEAAKVEKQVLAIASDFRALQAEIAAAKAQPDIVVVPELVE